MEIGIVGAGIMGRMLAWQLHLAGHQLSLFDKDPIDSGSAAAYTAAGMLTPYTEVESAEFAIFEMGLRALALWPKIIASLDADVGYQQRGSLVVSHGADRADYQLFQQRLFSKIQPGQAQFTTLNQQQLQALEPELAPCFHEACFLTEEGSVNSGLVMAVLAQRLQEQGAKWFPEATVTEIEAQAVVSDGISHSFDQVIDCRGLGAKVDLPELRGVRGEVVSLFAPEVNIQCLVRLMHPRYKIYVVPRPDNIYFIGATQIESEDLGNVTVRSALELLSAVYSMHTGFAEARILSVEANCRPALRDNLPKILFSDGVIRVNGLFRHGYLLAPILAQELVSWLDSDGQFQSEHKGLFQFSAELAQKSKNNTMLNVTTLNFKTKAPA